MSKKVIIDHRLLPKPEKIIKCGCYIGSYTCGNIATNKFVIEGAVRLNVCKNCHDTLHLLNVTDYENKNH